MTKREFLELRLKIETNPALTGEEIRFILSAMDKQDSTAPILDLGVYTCLMCDLTIAEGDKYCWYCGQKTDW